MLDTDLAELYGVSTKRLNEQVKRNRDRFPGDFMFQLNPAEVKKGAWRETVCAICLHGAWGDYVGCPSQHSPGNAGQCLGSAGFR